MSVSLRRRESCIARSILSSLSFCQQNCRSSLLNCVELRSSQQTPLPNSPNTRPSFSMHNTERCVDQCYQKSEGCVLDCGKSDMTECERTCITKLTQCTAGDSREDNEKNGEKKEEKRGDGMSIMFSQFKIGHEAKATKGCVLSAGVRAGITAMQRPLRAPLRNPNVFMNPVQANGRVWNRQEQQDWRRRESVNENCIEMCRTQRKDCKEDCHSPNSDYAERKKAEELAKEEERLIGHLGIHSKCEEECDGRSWPAAPSHPTPAPPRSAQCTTGCKPTGETKEIEEKREKNYLSDFIIDFAGNGHDRDKKQSVGRRAVGPTAAHLYYLR
ncbi:hypothetical protein BLNAU_4024 [Blattamonas nauphoetae]|uniref:Uncharacterized protein n=1 Tax=Blattamonas nauphoetae TaxID=2049346 RepID=A0ABQ9YB31_9EUKA|nr:hypothetical protein BLNAU_4024 [Blattamonas nauphoetae]